MDVAAVVSETIGSLALGTLYRWRARVQMASATGPLPTNPGHGPWRRPVAQAVEGDVRTTVALPACSNGADDDGDGLTDYPDDPGCGYPGDPSENAALLVCDDGADNDSDGLVDYPEDPGCQNVTATREDAQCQDGLDNDSDGTKDFDGGQSIHGACALGVCPPGVSDTNSDGIADPDPNCGTAFKNKETPNTGGGGCGIGPELALLLPGLMWLAGRRREPSTSGENAMRRSPSPAQSS